MSTLKLGSPLDKVNDMGPVVSDTQKASIETYVQSARDEGAEVMYLIILLSIELYWKINVTYEYKLST